MSNNKLKDTLTKTFSGKGSYIDLTFIKQTPEICLEAVKNYGFALQYVHEQTPEIRLAAVKNYGFGL
ncbi:MAG: DUF4116 domain-containing protein [Treponema sp.]|jgi:hypothetical protein|nr:DUF4116 domain-containing protein [Treponema sp.]